MKRLIAAGVLFALVLTAYFSAFFYVRNTCETAEKMLSECISAYENKRDAEAQAKELDEYWQNKERPLSVFANHSKIDELEQAISTLRVYSATEEEELFAEYSGTVKTLLHQLNEDITPSIHSIM